MYMYMSKCHYVPKVLRKLNLIIVQYIILLARSKSLYPQSFDVCHQLVTVHHHSEMYNNAMTKVRIVLTKLVLIESPSLLSCSLTSCAIVIGVVNVGVVTSISVDW